MILALLTCESEASVIPQNVASNNEESADLARHLAELVQTIIQFVRDGGNLIRDVTLAQLESFKTYAASSLIIHTLLNTSSFPANSRP